MNEKMLRLLVNDSYLDNSKGISKFEFIYRQQTNVRIENNSLVKEEVKNIISTLEDKDISVKVAGSFRRNNMYLDELTFIVIGSSKRSALTKCKDKINFESYSGDRANRIIKLGTNYLFEMFIFVSDKEYIPALIKYTGSFQFYKLYKHKLLEKGITKINASTEQEVFDMCGIPYLAPELRECVDDLSIPYADFIVDKEEKINGNIIPLKQASNAKNYELEYLGIYITLDEYIKNGKGLVTLLKSIKWNDVNIYVGLKLNNIKEYDARIAEEFDFIISGFVVDDFKDRTTISTIAKPLILDSFGTGLANPLRTVLCRTDWDSCLKRLAELRIPIGIDCANMINALHPFLLNKFKKFGGEIIVYNTEEHNFGKGTHLLRKSLVSKKSLIHNHFRFRKMMEGRSGN